MTAGDVARSFPERISRFVDAVPFETAVQVARDLGELASANVAGAGAVANRYPTAGLRAAIDELIREWRRTCPELSGDGLSIAIRATAIARREERAEQRIDPVWSGPDTPEIAVRSTREALIEVIRTARHRPLSGRNKVDLAHSLPSTSVNARRPARGADTNDNVANVGWVVATCWKRWQPPSEQDSRYLIGAVWDTDRHVVLPVSQ